MHFYKSGEYKKIYNDIIILKNLDNGLLALLTDIVNTLSLLSESDYRLEHHIDRFKICVYLIAHYYNKPLLITNQQEFSFEFLNKKMSFPEKSGYTEECLLKHMLFRTAVKFKFNSFIVSHIGMEFLNTQVPNTPEGYTNKHQLLDGAIQDNNEELISFFSKEFLDEPAPGKPPRWINRDLLLPKLRQKHRAAVIASYDKDDFEFIKFPMSGISTSNFTRFVQEALEEANNENNHTATTGVQYGEFYGFRFGKEAYSQLYWLAPPNYFRLRGDHSKYYFAGHLDRKPSHVICAFFQGLTTAECGSTLQASTYWSILHMMGTKNYNLTFKKTLTPFIISILQDSQYDLQNVKGNPLYFLFDKIGDDFFDFSVQTGDLLYITGVQSTSDHPYSYKDKHPIGCEKGYHVLCVGKNKQQENLYLGFGLPKLTLREIKKWFIDSYNQPPTKESQNNTSFKLALLNDQIKQNYSEVGSISDIMRFNPKKLETFLLTTLARWHRMPVSHLFDKVYQTVTNHPVYPPKMFYTLSEVELLTFRQKTVSNYQTKSKIQHKLLNIAYRFIYALCDYNAEPKGFILTSPATIGKTHLALAVANFAVQQGLRVLFISGTCLLTENKENLRDLEQDLSQTDLIIIDNIDIKYTQHRNLLSLALNFVKNNNKGIFINSRGSVSLCLKELLPEYVQYDNPFADAFCLLEDIQIPSLPKYSRHLLLEYNLARRARAPNINIQSTNFELATDSELEVFLKAYQTSYLRLLACFIRKQADESLLEKGRKQPPKKLTLFFIPNATLAKRELIKTLSGHIIPSLENSSYVKILIISEVLKKDIREQLAINRQLATLAYDIEERCNVLQNDPMLTLEKTECPDKFLVTFPRSKLDFIRNIISDDKWNLHKVNQSQFSIFHHPKSLGNNKKHNGYECKVHSC